MKIYDCSNSQDRPQNRGYGGPRENAVVTMLKRYAANYDAEFVANPVDADLIFTNDVYPANIVALDKPKVKRMDGVFWQEHLADRNDAYNRAAAQSDCVIFVSNFSRESLKRLYGKQICNRSVVVLNSVDSDIFYRGHPVVKERPYRFMAVATHWAREEKRLSAVLKLAALLGREMELILIGSIPITKLPENVTNFGYVADPQQLSCLLRMCDAFVNFSYRDAAPKAVAEAVACGLPVLCTTSGGVPELVTEASAVFIKEDEYWGFEPKSPDLDINYIFNGFGVFLMEYKDLLVAARERTCYTAVNMLQGYFDAFGSVLA